MKKSISTNFFYNFFYQLITVLSPLITAPYVSRVLGKNGIGINSYTSSITQYFILIGSLGISTYANRQIAYIRDNKDELSKCFWSISILKFTTTLISLTIYLLIFVSNKTYGNIYLIQSISILASAFDICWFYSGLEDFKKIVTRNLTIKIIFMFSIFIFIKTSNDLPKYVFMNVLMALIGNIVMWIYIPNIISKTKINVKEVFSHIKPAVQMFIPQLAIQIYTILDRTQLGLLSNVSEVGLYEQSQKIIRLVLSLVTCLSTVMFPRMSNIFANGDNDKMNRYFNKSLILVAYITIPMSAGIIGISKEFVPWFFGKDFTDVSYLLIILTPLFFFIGMSNVMGNQYLLPANKIKLYTTSVVSGSLVNITLNFILIPVYKSIGACISSVIAELSVAFIQYLYLRHIINHKEYFRCFLKYMSSSLIMIIVLRIMGNKLGSHITTTFIQIVTGIIMYIFILTIMREKTNKTILEAFFIKFKAIISLN